MNLALKIHLSSLPAIQYGKRVYIPPFNDSAERLSGNVFEVYLRPYFFEAYRSVHKGDAFKVRGGMREVEFKVTKTGPAGMQLHD